MEIAFVNTKDYICNMKDRIRKLLLDEGLTSGAFADEIGVQRSSLSHILNGRNNPSLDFVIKTKNRFQKLNLSWLLLGTGDMYSIDNQDNRSSIEPNITTPNIFNNLPEEKNVEPRENYSETLDIPSISESLDSSQVDQIVVFYSDQSFRTYRPRKNV